MADQLPSCGKTTVHNPHGWHDNGPMTHCPGVPGEQPMPAPNDSPAIADLTARAQAGEALYWAIYYGHADWIQAVVTGAPKAFTAAFMRAQNAFGCDAIGYQWTNPMTGEKHMLSPHDVAIIRRSDR